MKTRKKHYPWILLSFALFNLNLSAQEKKETVNFHMMNAIEKAVVKYHQQKDVGYKKHAVITMRLMNINEKSGDFILRFIVSIGAYNDLQPTHYICAGDEIVLIKVDNACNCNPEEFGISKVTEEVKNEVLMLLAGSVEEISIVYNSTTNRMDTLLRKRSIIGQPSPEMIFSYKKDEINSLLYNYGSTPVYGKEYWGNWKLLLSPAQKKQKPFWVKKLNANVDLKKTDEAVKDSLQKFIETSVDLSSGIRNQDLNELTFKPIFLNRLYPRDNFFNDTVSIYSYIEMDTTYKQPYQVLIFKKNNFWGRLTFDEDETEFKPVSEFYNDRFGKKEIDLYEKILRQKANLLFYIDYFNHSFIWYTKSDKIFVLFHYENYQIIEADEYIHRFYTKENIIKKMRM